MKSLSISTRLALLIVVFAIALSVIGAMGLHGMRRSNEATREIYEHQLTSSLALAEARANQLLVRVLLDQGALAPDSPDLEKRIATAEGFAAKSKDAWGAYMKLPREPEQDQLAAAVAQKHAEFFDKGANVLIAALRSGDRDRITTAVMETVPALDRTLNTSRTELAKLQLALGKATFDASQAQYMQLRQISFAAIAATILLTVAIAWMLRAAILRPLGLVADHLSRIAQGDLTRRLETRRQDEFGKLLEGLETMQSSLVRVVREVRNGTDSMATATQQIASGNMDLSQRTEQQASSLQQTSSSMSELTSTVQQNAENARQARALGDGATTAAQQGRSVVGQVVQTMQAINESSRKIADIIGVIDGIAFQTNILALNAAVEAARAGEQGRGFAVVASEVRALAQRSADAATQIKTLISDSVGQVSSGVSLVESAQTAMGEIGQSIQRVNDILAEIGAASNEQASGIQQVDQAVSQMDSVAQQNAALVEQAAAAAGSLEEQAGRLKQTVETFRLPIST